ncbi:unnamed protein product [Rangifer tarandus platyrhynchus]|uniref:Uncharacterized protein n=1 Tax=Rangifer tarandus platyrhynchus TaxID=3082113 RepID=A0AC59ZEM7_RANTA
MRPLCRTLQWDFPGGSDGEASTHNAGDLGSILVLGRSPGGNGNPPQYSWVGKIPWRRKCQPTPVFLPGKSHGLRNLVPSQSFWLVLLFFDEEKILHSKAAKVIGFYVVDSVSGLINSFLS